MENTKATTLQPATQSPEVLEALTPSAATKAAYMGEFSFTVPYTDEDGDEQYRKVLVPWCTIKEIMAAIRNRAALSHPKHEGGMSDDVKAEKPTSRSIVRQYLELPLSQRREIRHSVGFTDLQPVEEKSFDCDMRFFTYLKDNGKVEEFTDALLSHKGV